MTRLNKRRARKCRICEFPALDTGVPAAQFQKEKLAEWWLQKFNTELDDEGQNTAVICQFCIWDARFEDEHSEKLKSSRDTDWWKGFDTNLDYYENYYQEQQLQRLQVKLTDVNQEPDTNQQSSADVKEPLQSPENNNKKSERSPLSCIYCDSNKTFIYKKSLKTHLKVCHSDEIIQCEYTNTCAKIFKTVKDLELHIYSFHERRKNVRDKKKKQCIIRQVRNKDVAIKSDITQTCPTTLTSQIEKESPIDKDIPTNSLLVKCIYCKISLINTQNLAAHVAQTHVKIKIECSVAGCETYFLTQSECMAHLIKNHPDVENAKILQCPECSYGAPQEEQLKDHIAEIHQISQFKCPECTKLFRSELSYKYHLTFLCKVKRSNAFSVKISSEF